jgi:trigger factor
MQVIRQDVNEVQAILRIELEQEDYKTRVKTTLDKYRKTAKIPGFRQGNVPFGLIEKQYGKAVLSEQLNELIKQSLDDYIKDNQLSILGDPIPREGVEMEGNFQQPDRFAFEFEIGITPSFDLPVLLNREIEYTRVLVDDELVLKQIDDLSRRYGKLVDGDSIEETDYIFVQLDEMNDAGELKEGGISHKSSLLLSNIENAEAKKALIGSKVGDALKVFVRELARDEADLNELLGIKDQPEREFSDHFRLTVTEIKRMLPAEWNQELFDKLYGEGAISDGEQLKARVEKDLQQMYTHEEKRKFTMRIYEFLMENTSMNLPEEFLKRWMKLVVDKPLSNDEWAREHDIYFKGIKWQLIQNKWMAEQNVEISYDEVLEFTKQMLVSNYQQYGIPAPEEEELSLHAKDYLNSREKINKTYELLAEQKLTDRAMEIMQLKEVYVPYETFKSSGQA